MQVTPSLRKALSFILPLLLASPLLAQQPPDKSVPNKEQVPSTTRTSEAPEVLQNLNSALEGLVAKVSPAVVQVLVTGLAPVENSNRNDTALIARQHAVGSG